MVPFDRHVHYKQKYKVKTNAGVIALGFFKKPYSLITYEESRDILDKNKEGLITAVESLMKDVQGRVGSIYCVGNLDLFVLVWPTTITVRCLHYGGTRTIDRNDVERF